MPSPRLRVRRRNERITAKHWLALGRGPSFNEPWYRELRKAPATVEYVDAVLADMRWAWNAVKRSLLAHWIKAKPGTRPYAWWLFDAPEKHRRVLSGVGYTEMGPNPKMCEAVRRTAIHFGICGIWATPEEPKSLCESEYQYLARLGLLTAAEKRIPASEFPETNEGENWYSRRDDSWLPLNLT